MRTFISHSRTGTRRNGWGRGAKGRESWRNMLCRMQDRKHISGITHGAKSSPLRCSSCGTREYTNGGDSYPGEPKIYAAVFRFRAERSGAVTENARISNGGKEERTSEANIKSRGGMTTKGREYRAEFSVLAKRSRKTSAIGPDGWSMGGYSGLF